MSISFSDIEVDDLSVSEQDALSLSRAAIQLDQARDDPGQMAIALESNLMVWVAIRTLMGQTSDIASEDAANNLVRLSQFVAASTMKYGVEMPGEILDTLISINLQISEGLLEGAES